MHVLGTGLGVPLHVPVRRVDLITFLHHGMPTPPPASAPFGRGTS